ncbi:hypothetical protein AAJCM20276_09970 [Acetobacter aceti]|uniref:Uncharacterized protein n=1 Tax=Acetobacter aceti TaxID=435 RepID=A0A6S6PGI0_ACEAC|nr:hypothetical protein AAJCM20276_09970 [Acetobacter aceti]
MERHGQRRTERQGKAEQTLWGKWQISGVSISGPCDGCFLFISNPANFADINSRVMALMHDQFRDTPGTK